MWYPRPHRSSPGNDSDTANHVLGIANMVDWHPNDSGYPQYHIQLDRPMEHRAPTQHQNFQPHHTRPTPTPRSIPELPATTICNTPPFPPLSPHTGSPTGSTKHSPQPPRTPPPIQPEQTSGNGQTQKLNKHLNSGGGSHHPISESGQNNPTPTSTRTMARNTRKPHHHHLHRWL